MTTDTAVERIRRRSDEFIDIRRDLHAHPEPGCQERRTATLVCTIVPLGTRAGAAPAERGLPSAAQLPVPDGARGEAR